MLDEGKNRQIRRMLEALGVEVLRLVRVAIGPLQLGKLAKGAFRRADAKEAASATCWIRAASASKAEYS